MKRFLLILPLIFLAEVLFAQAASQSPFGIWTTNPDLLYPFARGCWIQTRWKDIEPEKGKYDFSVLEKKLNAAMQNGYPASVMVMVGPDCPEWLYDEGVPRVETSETFNPQGISHKGRWPCYPYYLDPVYIKYWFNHINRVADWVESLPDELRNNILFVQTAEGTTGDQGAYKGQLYDPKYDLPQDDPRWINLKIKAWKIYRERYGNMKPPVRLLINTGNHQEYEGILDTLFTDLWKKAATPGHIFQFKGEKTYFENLKGQLWKPLPNGEFRRFRSELDETVNGWFQEAPVQNMYWLCLFNLHFGIDMLRMHYYIFDELEGYRTGLDFFSKYAGQKDPATAIGAFCAMKDVLDAADTGRFPEKQYGRATMVNSERFSAIAREYESFGARLGDPVHAIGITTNNQRSKAINDVGFDLLPGNYEVFLTQIEPNATSQGWWNIGPVDQPYGRFARSFDTAAGKNTMYFALDKGFFAQNASRSMKVRVVYLDQGKGSWSLCYVDNKGKVKTASSVTNTDSGDWKEITTIIGDAAFAGNGPKGADLMLHNDSGDDSVFHMVELMRL